MQIKVPLHSPLAWLAIGAVFGAVFACPCGVGVGWLTWHGADTGGIGTVMGNGTGQKSDGATYQGLQDSLAARGVKTQRALGKQGMWFAIGDTKPDTGWLDEMRRFRRYRSPAGVDAFLATKFDSAASAKREMDRIKDLHQRESLAWESFLLESDANTLAVLRKSLR